jgi:Mrp family chromosome partitioning ATPase
MRDANAKPSADSSRKAHEDDGTLVDWYLSHLQVIPIPNTKLVTIGFTGADPNLITRLSNAHAEAAVADSVAANRNDAQHTLKWALKQLEKQKREIERAQQEIVTHKKNNDVVSVKGRQNIVAQALSETSSSLNRARAERLAKESTYNQLEDLSSRGQDLFSLPEVAQDPVIQNLRQQLTTMKAEKLEMTTRFGFKHPMVIEATHGIESLEKVIDRELNRIKLTIKNEMDRAVHFEKQIEATLNKQKAQAQALDAKDIQYDVLVRDLNSSRKVYDALLENAKKIGMLKMREAGNIKIVDRAEVPRYPTRPRIALNLLLAVVLGLFMGIGLTFFVEYMDNTLKTPDDVVQQLRIPVIGTIPFKKLIQNKPQPVIELVGQNKVIKASKAKTDHYLTQHLLPSVLQLGSEIQLGQVIMVKSASTGEGKSTVLANLGLNFAAAGMRTLVMDMDFQRPSQHVLFRLDNEKGLSDAMVQILGRRISSGNLSECSVADLFFLIGLNKKSGILVVKNDNHSMRAYFSKGRLVQVRNSRVHERYRLGRMLINAGTITESQLQDALDCQQRSNQSLPLGYIFVNSGYVSRDRLQGLIKLQTEEYLCQLFSWNTGIFTFTPGQLRVHGTNRIAFEEDYSAAIQSIGGLESSRLLENELLSRIQSTIESNLFVLSAGSRHATVRAVFNLRLMTILITFLKQHFDALLLDTPPLDVDDGGSVLAELVDGVVLVVKAGHLPVNAIRRSLSTIPNQKIVGAILNQVKIKGRYQYYK